MITEHELLEEIEKCQRDPVTYTGISKLADLYTVYDHMYGIPEPNYSGMNAERMKIIGDTEFLKIVDRTNVDKVWNVMDELMSVLKISNPNLYEGVIRQLEE